MKKLVDIFAVVIPSKNANEILKYVFSNENIACLFGVE